MFSLVLILVSLPLTAVARPSHAAVPIDSLRQIARSCAVQPYALKSDGRKVHGALRSTCPELKVVGSRADFRLQTGLEYAVTVADSEDSDGGDLNDVTIIAVQASEGSDDSIVQRNVLAFGDPVLAVLGGSTDGLPEVLDPSLAR